MNPILHQLKTWTIMRFTVAGKHFTAFNTSFCLDWFSRITRGLHFSNHVRGMARSPVVNDIQRWRYQLQHDYPHCCYSTQYDIIFQPGNAKLFEQNQGTKVAFPKGHHFRSHLTTHRHMLRSYVLPCSQTTAASHYLQCHFCCLVVDLTTMNMKPSRVNIFF